MLTSCKAKPMRGTRATSHPLLLYRNPLPIWNAPQPTPACSRVAHCLAQASWLPPSPARATQKRRAQDAPSHDQVSSRPQSLRKVDTMDILRCSPAHYRSPSADQAVLAALAFSTRAHFHEGVGSPVGALPPSGAGWLCAGHWREVPSAHPTHRNVSVNDAGFRTPRDSCPLVRPQPCLGARAVAFARGATFWALAPPPQEALRARCHQRQCTDGATPHARSYRRRQRHLSPAHCPPPRLRGCPVPASTGSAGPEKRPEAHATGIRARAARRLGTAATRPWDPPSPLRLARR